jgi:hypothetical protein
MATTDKFTIIEHKIIPVDGTSNISLVSSFATTLAAAEVIANKSSAPFVEIKDPTGTQVFTKGTAPTAPAAAVDAKPLAQGSPVAAPITI